MSSGNTFSEEITCSVAPHRLFHGLYIDSHNLRPKIMPEVKSVERYGGPEGIEQVNFVDGYPVKQLKYKLEFIDKENCEIKYSAIECAAFGDKIDRIAYEVKIDANGDGGSICKIKIIFIPKGDAVIDEGLLKAGREGYMEKFPVFIAHLTENPHLYA